MKYLAASGALLFAGAGLVVVWLSGVEAPTEVSGPPRNGPERERALFADWHEPYGAVLEPDRLSALWSDVSNLPEEGDRGVNSWQPLGPNGMTTGTGARYSGRILDLESRDDSGLRAAAATGGLWEYVFAFPVPMTDRLLTQCVSTLSTDPRDALSVLIGTGEYGLRGGLGVWKTNDGGLTWSKRPMSPEPSVVFRIRRHPLNPDVVWSGTDQGFFLSTDAGDTWTRTLSGVVTDLDFNAGAPNHLVVTVAGDGVYENWASGTQGVWVKFTESGLPSTDLGRGAVSLAASHLGYYYVAFANSSHELRGVYRTTDYGATWINVSPPSNYMGTQGWYDNVISVSPWDPDVVLVGGVTLWKTETGGLEFSWSEISDPHLHVDYHALTWSEDGLYLYAGHDGGWSVSDDHGWTWSSTLNVLPITQYVHFHNGVDQPAFLAGGSQDNGISITTDGGSTWSFRRSGDGGGVAVDPSDAGRLWISDGVYDGDLAFRRYRSTDSGVSWVDVNSGIDPSGLWFVPLRHDQVSPVYLYTLANHYVYESTNGGDLWVRLNDSSPFTVPPSDVTASRYAWPKAVVYAPLWQSTPGDRLWVYDDDGFYQRDAGLPTGTRVRRVAPHPIAKDVGYALMNGLATPGEKVFRTTDRGATWTNVTGDLPNVPVADLVAHPYTEDVLYLGTEFGCFRTTDGGVRWHRWNHGLPEAVIVTQMSWSDQLEQAGEFHILIGTYGRGIWQREISGDDPADASLPAALPARYGFGRPEPNPFRESTALALTLPARERVRVSLHSVDGRELTVIRDEILERGSHDLTVAGEDLPAGIYFVRLSAGRFTESRRVVRLQ